MWWRRDWISQSVNENNFKRIFSNVLGNRYPSYFPFVLLHGIMVEYKIPLFCKDVTVFIHSYKKHAEHLIRDHCTGYYPWEEKKVKKNFFSWPSQNIPILPSNNCCSAGICPRIEGIEWSFENFYYPHISVKEVPKQK